MADKNTKNDILNEKLDFYRYSHAAHCFHLALRALELLEEHYDDPILNQIYAGSFIVNAAKPFKQDERRPKNLKINRRNGAADIKFGGYLGIAEKFHNKLLLLRDKFYAHTDLNIGDGNVENKCMVESSYFDDGDLGVNEMFSTATIRKEEIEGYKYMMQQQYDLFEQKAHLVLEPHIEELLEAGFYELVLDCHERWFIPMSSIGEDDEPIMGL